VECFELRDYVLRELNILPSEFSAKRAVLLLKTQRFSQYIFYDKHSVGNIRRKCHSEHLKPETVMI